MASYTTNLNLKKPAGSENVAIGDINGNMDTIDTAVGTLRSQRTWTNILEKTTTANVNFDETVAVSYPTDPKEIMLTLQRVSNGRTFAASVIPFSQFAGGALYAMGMYAIYSGALNGTSNAVINAVAIDTPGNQIEVALNAHTEAIKIRVFVR